MNLYYLRKTLSILILLPSVAIAQLTFEGTVKDKDTETELESNIITKINDIVKGPK